jgi:hypothetical protein
VWRVRAQDVNLLVRPAELFFDQRVLRVLRDDVASVELVGGGAKRVLARAKDGWTVREGDGPVYPGDPGAVEEVLAILEREELGEHLVDQAFQAEDPPLSVTVVLRNDARQGGQIGARRATSAPAHRAACTCASATRSRRSSTTTWSRCATARWMPSAPAARTTCRNRACARSSSRTGIAATSS